MTEVQIARITPDEMVFKFKESLKEFFEEYNLKPTNNGSGSNKPHRTRKETAEFFGVSLNCINDWSKKGILKPIKVGQRTYFKYSDLLEVMFNQTTKEG